MPRIPAEHIPSGDGAGAPDHEMGGREGARRELLRAIADHAPQALEDLRRLLPRHRLIFQRLIPEAMTETEYAEDLRRKRTPFSGILLHELAEEELVVTGAKTRRPPASRRSRYIFRLQAQPESLLWLHDELHAWARRHRLETADRWFVRQALYQLDDWRCSKTPSRGSWDGDADTRRLPAPIMWLTEYQINAVDAEALAERFGQEEGAMLGAVRQLAEVMGLVPRGEGGGAR